MYRTTALALTVAAALTACADATAPTPAPAVASPGTPSFAQSSTRQQVNEWFDIAGTFTNPCNGERIAYTGRIHENGWFDYDGTTLQVQLHVNTADVHGVGVSSGLNYVLLENDHEAVYESFDPFTETFRFSQHFAVISQGSTDNFESQLSYTFTYPPGTVDVKQDNARCTG